MITIPCSASHSILVQVWLPPLPIAGGPNRKKTECWSLFFFLGALELPIIVQEHYRCTRIQQ